MLQQCDIVNAKFVYSIYFNIKNYFHGNFDYFKYQGLNKRATKNFDEHHKAFYPCLNIYRAYRTIENIEKYIVSNIWNSSKWFTDFKETYYNNIRAFEESRRYTLEKDLKQFFRDSNYNKRFNDYQLFYKCFQNGSITTNTLIYLNACLKVLDRYYECSDDFLFKEDYQKLCKLQKFYEKWEVIDKQIFKEVVRNLIKDLET